MMWQYSRRDTKLLLLATLFVFSAFGLMLSNDFQTTYSEPKQLTANSVGVLAAVPENPINTLSAQLDERERAITERESMLTNYGQNDARMLIILSIIGVALLGLILLNFYLDTRRRHSLL